MGVQGADPDSRLHYEFTALLFIASKLGTEQYLPKGTTEMAAIPAARARGPLPDDEALTDGAERLAAATAAHLNGIGSAEASRGRRGDNHL